MIMDCYIYGDSLDTIWIIDKKLLYFELSKSGQIFMCIDKTIFSQAQSYILLEV